MYVMAFPVTELPTAEFPALLREIPQPPQKLNYRGALPSPELTLLAVVGSRKYTNYGKQAVERLIGGLRGAPVGIVSGLALGIDSLAHEAALAAGLYTLAIPGGGLDDSVIYPARHKPLARRILDHNGGLLSEYEPKFRATPWSFPQRNRLVCGIAKATLVVEADERSGSLITARMTSDYNRELMVVPGSIFSHNSRGTHQFLKLGATPVTTPEDILEALHVSKRSNTPSTPLPQSPIEKRVLEFLSEPKARDEMIRELNIDTATASRILMQMELAGHIRETDGMYFKNE